MGEAGNTRDGSQTNPAPPPAQASFPRATADPPAGSRATSSSGAHRASLRTFPALTVLLFGAT